MCSFVAEVVDDAESADTPPVNSNCLYFYLLLVETFFDRLYGLYFNYS